jgi:hypothetical protein
LTEANQILSNLFVQTSKGDVHDIQNPEKLGVETRIMELTDSSEKLRDNPNSKPVGIKLTNPDAGEYLLRQRRASTPENEKNCRRKGEHTGKWGKKARCRGERERERSKGEQKSPEIERGVGRRR